MPPYGTTSTARSDDCDSSIGSSFFKDINSHDSQTLGTMGHDDDNLSVQTPSVAEESVASDSMCSSAVQSSMNSSANRASVFDDEVSVSTPSVVSERSQSFRSAAPRIRSVQTPSVHEDNDMDQSVFGSVIHSVIHTMYGKKDKNDSKYKGGYEEPIIDLDASEDYDEENAASQVVEEEFDHFMNEFNEKSVDIMRKRSTGLIQVMSTLDKGNDEEDNEEDRIDPFETYTPDMLFDEKVVEQKYNQNVDDSSVQSGWSKSTRMSRRSSRSRLVATGLKGLGRRGSRSMSPSPMKSKFASMLQSNDDEASIAISIDSSQPPTDTKTPFKNSKNKFVNRGVSNVTKADLDKRRDLELLLSVKKYEEMLELINENPKLIAIQTNQPSGKTFLHVIASMAVPPPETVILKVVAVDTSLVTVTDNNNNTPLHYASQHVRKGNMHAFTVLLKFHPMGACEHNSDGDLPLHIVASNSSHGAEEAAHLLLETNPKAITEPNSKGKVRIILMVYSDFNLFKTDFLRL